MSHANQPSRSGSQQHPQLSLSNLQLPVAKHDNDNVTLVLSNCTFTGCPVALSGQATNQAPQMSIDQKIVEETLQDIMNHNSGS